MKQFSAKPKKICEILGISRPTLRKLTREAMFAGEHYFVVGRSVRYDEAAVVAWTKNRAIAS